MKLYTVISDEFNYPLAIYDTFEKAKQYVDSKHKGHYCVFEYDLNTEGQGNNIYDNMVNNIF